MEYVSSDTNVWIDFSVIGRIELPFRLPYKFIMNSDAIKDELLSPPGLCDELLRHGLLGVQITIEEFEIAETYGNKYPRLSVYDRIALAIAKTRNIVLLTGDKSLRKAAICENVNFLGTIGVLDKLLDGNYINEYDYKFCLLEFQKHNNKKIRLPKSEIASRLQNLD
jgi:predicted nucleic acid-binding protein